MAAGTSSTSTPEYMTFRKCYPTIIHYVKKQPGTFCDALFANNYIPITVRDYTRNKYISDEEKAQKLTDTLIDRIEQELSVFHGFIKIIKEDGPWASNFFETIRECYEHLRLKLQEQSQHTEMSEKELPQAGAHRTSVKEEEHSSSSSDDSFHSTTEPNQTSKFPYLDVSSLSENEKADLEVQLRLDIINIKARFSDFRVAIRDSLESRVPLDKIKDSILSLEAFTDGIGVKVLDPEDEKKIEMADSMSKIFMTLRTYISFFNYEIIEWLISQYGTNDDKKMLQEYCQALDAFSQRNVYEIPPRAYSGP